MTCVVGRGVYFGIVVGRGSNTCDRCLNLTCSSCDWDLQFD